MYYNTSNKITKNNIDLSKYSSKSIWKSGEYLKIGDFKESPNGKVKIYVALIDDSINLRIKDLNEYYKDFSGNKIYDRNLDNLWMEELNKHKNDLCYQLADGNTFNFRIGYVKNNTFTNIFDECNGTCGSFKVLKHADDKINKIIPVKKTRIAVTSEENIGIAVTSEENIGNAYSFVKTVYDENGNKIDSYKELIYTYDNNGNIIDSLKEFNLYEGSYNVYNISFILLRDDGAFIFDKNNILQGII
jgi:hypothetical protein